MLHIVLPVTLGLIAVYLLLPRPKRYSPVWGASAAGLALLLAGWLLIRDGVADAETLLFYAFSFIAVVGGGLLVTQRNPVHAALSFALVVLSTCGLFLLQAAPFLMAATIIIYAGAIIVTFLFVIMLAQQAGLSDADYRSREPLLSCVAGFVLLGALLYLLYRDSEGKTDLTASYDATAFESLLERAYAAQQKNTPQQIVEALHEDGLDEFSRLALAARGSPAADELAKRVAEARQRWITWKSATGKAEETQAASQMRAALAELTQLGQQLQTSRDGDRARLPAENVAYLGRALFTDYLLPVELAGTLLLVAAIGAIAIAGRRTEGLR